MSTMERDSAGETDRTTLGLATRRRKQKISLDQIAQATKIAMRSLQAIETEDFKKLPGGIYNTSYIRQYARAIEFDESELLAYYHSHNSELTPDPSLINLQKKVNLRDFRFIEQH